MGRYFNDDMIEDQNEDYDAYLEHFGIPKEKWDANVRAKFDAMHHKTKDAYRSISDGAKRFGSKASKQINGAGQKVKNHFTKPKFRGIEYGRDVETGKKAPYFHYDTDAEHNVEQAAKGVEKGIKKVKKTGKNLKKNFDKKTTYTTQDGKKIRGIYTPSGFITVNTPKKSKKKSLSKSSQNSPNTFSFDEKSGTTKAPKGYKKVSSNQSTTRKAVHQHQQSINGSPYKSADGFVSKEWAEEQARKAGYSTTRKRHVSSDYERELEYNSRKNVYPKKMKRSR